MENPVATSPAPRDGRRHTAAIAAPFFAHGERYSANHGLPDVFGISIVPDATGCISHRRENAASNDANTGTCASFEAVHMRRYDMLPAASGTILLGKMTSFPMVRGEPLTMGYTRRRFAAVCRRPSREDGKDHRSGFDMKTTQMASARKCCHTHVISCLFWRDGPGLSSVICRLSSGGFGASNAVRGV